MKPVYVSGDGTYHASPVRVAGDGIYYASPVCPGAFDGVPRPRWEAEASALKPCTRCVTAIDDATEWPGPIGPKRPRS